MLPRRVVKIELDSLIIEVRVALRFHANKVADSRSALKRSDSVRRLAFVDISILPGSP